MEHVRLGSTGLKVSRICLGMMSFGDPAARKWALDEEGADPIVRRAVNAGITFFDTADVYSGGVSEEITGSLLSRFFPSRDDYVLATKVFFPAGPGPNDRGLSRKHILAGIDASLRRLGTDHVDLYQIHRFDPETPVEETMEALHDVVRAGKARYLGASSMYAWQFAKMQHAADREEREMIPLCLDQGVGVIPWSPLARGLLAGNRGRGGEKRTLRANTDGFGETLYSDEDFDVVDVVVEIAREKGVKPAQVALAWLLSRPGVTAPIVGATKLEHLEDALGAIDVTLSDEEIKRLEAPYRPHTIRGHQ